jgi:hypothetical protein
MQIRPPFRNLFLLSCPALALALVALEVALRLFGYTLYYLDKDAFIPSRNPEILYQLRPGFRGLYAGAPVTVNSSGFRGKEWRTANASETTRVVVLGDSVAFGQGVQEGETLAEQLEARLQRKLPYPVEVVNLGVPGYDTCQEWWTFKERALPLMPRVAVLLYVENDTDPPVFQVQGEEVISPDVRTGFLGTFLAAARKRSALYNVTWMRWQAFKVGSFSIERYREILSHKFSDTNPGWRRSREYLTKLTKLAQANAIRLIVIPVPVLWGLADKPYPFDCYIRAVCTAAGTAGAEYLDVVPILQDRDLRARVSERDPHPSAEVFRRIANQLADMIP